MVCLSHASLNGCTTVTPDSTQNMLGSGVALDCFWFVCNTQVEDPRPVMYLALAHMCHLLELELH